MMLKEGVRDHGHQYVAMQASPRAAFEVVEAEFFVEFVRKVPPACVFNGGTTGESNNLNFVPSTASPGPRSSALSSAQLRYATIAG
jgi:hypothetical protein